MDDALSPTVGAGAGEGSAASQPQESSNQQAPIEGEATKLLNLLESKLNERFSAFEGQLKGLQRVQGEIDRSREDFKQKLEQLNKLTKQGMSQDEALAQLDAQQADRDRWQKFEQELANIKSLINGNGNGQMKQETVTEVFSSYGLDVKDPRVSPFLAKQYANKNEMELAALKVFHAIQTSPTPNQAQQPSLEGGAGRRDAKDISQVNDSSTLYDLASKDLLG